MDALIKNAKNSFTVYRHGGISHSVNNNGSLQMQEDNGAQITFSKCFTNSDEYVHVLFGYSTEYKSFYRDMELTYGQIIELRDYLTNCIDNHFRKYFYVFVYDEFINHKKFSKKIKSAEFVSIHKLTCKKLVFNIPDNRQGYKPNLSSFNCRNDNVVWGVIYKFDANEKSYLDSLFKVNGDVTSQTITCKIENDNIECLVYLNDSYQSSNRKTKKEYLDSLISESLKLNFPFEYVENLKKTPYF
jgi:hypothetical protein